MSKEERLQLENELLMTCSKAQAINKYIDELEESSKLSELWCTSQERVRNLENQLKQANEGKEEQKRRKELIQKKRDKHKIKAYKLQQRIDKAIKYIEEMYNDEYISYGDKAELLLILKCDESKLDELLTKSNEILNGGENNR